MRRFATWSVFTALAIGSLHLQAQAGAPGSLAQASPPTYPLAAKAAGVEGKVVLKCVIDVDGHVKDLQVVEGPPELRQAAMDAVMHWTYHPYTDHGKPIPVAATANVNFTLGNKKQKAREMADARAALAKEAESNADASKTKQ